MQDGKRLEFWESRQTVGDPMADTAVKIVKNTGVSVTEFMGAGANGRLRDALYRRDRALGVFDGLSEKYYSGIEAEINQVGVELMQNHVAYIDLNQGYVPTPQQVDSYHIDVFGRHGLTPNAFGGRFSSFDTINQIAIPMWYDDPN